MAKRNIKFNLDFSNKDILPKFNIKQFDNALITISTYLEGNIFNPTGNTCKLYVSIGKEVFLQESNISVLENAIKIDLDKNIISEGGKGLGELELSDINGILTSATFLFNIDSKIGEGSTIPGQVEGFIAKHERLIKEFKEEYNSRLEIIQTELNTNTNRIDQVESKNEEQDSRLLDIEEKNKVQDVYIQGLFNENKDGRLTIEGEGNSLKLEGSKEGLVTIDKVVGNTLVNEEMQSTFENCKVTQEMVESGEESVKNLGKYKCEVVINGKNLLGLQDVTQTLDLTGSLSPQSGVSKGSIIYKNVDVSSFKGQYILSGDFTLDSNKYNLKVICHNIENTKNTHNDSYNYLIQKNGGKEFNFNTTIDLTNYKYITITTGNIVPLESKIYTVKVNKLQIEEGTQVSSHEPYYYSTKTIYLNSPLHKSDEIVYIDGELKHYHKMGRYLLSHNNDIRMYDNNLPNYNKYGLAMTGYKFKPNGEGCCDKIPYIQNNSDDIFHVRLDGTKPYGGLTLWLPKQYGSTVDELKTYMRDNNIEYNLILELAEPYYETIDTDRLLLEIPNNATVSVKSVVPVQSMAASYTNGIPNVYGLQETNQVQDDLINISLLATDEMYTMLEPILESIPQVINNERTMSKMVDMYVAMVIRGLKTIEDVPARYRKEVQDILNKLEK
ncbi:CD1375 family protein [Romboutsia sp. Marseille-P6047]|uniref:CD1375 family protein n=1 Tax=Romboutsia sp. Marseille-P6047 TaxID=2161817 RepID=UPI000F061EAF|nr:CD1375 family protein [Romboutsia sp. Marseille-P6047]